MALWTDEQWFERKANKTDGIEDAFRSAGLKFAGWLNRIPQFEGDADMERVQKIVEAASAGDPPTPEIGPGSAPAPRKGVRKAGPAKKTAAKKPATKSKK